MRRLVAMLGALCLALWGIAGASAEHAFATGLGPLPSQVQSADTAVTGTFSYLAFDSTLQTYDYSYDDAWFLRSAYDYNHELTRMSVRVAMAAFDTSYANGSTAASDRAANVLALAADLGFCSDPDSSLLTLHYPTPDTNTIGYLITSKRLDDDTSLVLVAIRGGGYGREWGGDFKLGSGVTHEGFQIAADQVLLALEQYVETNADVLGACKVWICGYSRGAAAANLVASSLDRGAIEGIRARDVFARCIECPRITRDPDAAAALYSNIYTIENPLDFVMRFAFEAWGYDRYGSICALPSMEATPGYDRLKRSMVEEYQRILDARSLPLEIELDDLVDEAPGEAMVFDAFFDAVASYVGGPEEFERTYQDGLVTFAQDYLALGVGTPTSVLVDIAQGKVSLFFEVSLEYPLEVGATVLHLTANNALSVHNAELCLAWVDALDTVEVTRGGRPPGTVSSMVMDIALP